MNRAPILYKTRPRDLVMPYPYDFQDHIRPYYIIFDHIWQFWKILYILYHLRPTLTSFSHFELLFFLPFWTTMLGMFGPAWTYFDLFGPVKETVNLFGPIWTQLDPFGPICTSLDSFGLYKIQLCISGIYYNMQIPYYLEHVGLSSQLQPKN